MPTDNPEYEQAAGQSVDTINNPDLNPSTLAAARPAITDARQAWSIFTRLQTDNNDRSDTNATIAERYKGSQPYEDAEIESWQSNFPTLFLAGTLNRVVPQLTAYIENAQSLTQSKIKDESSDGLRKTDQLRNLFTKRVRRWTGWRSFCSSLCQELILIGYTFACRTDEYDWRPRFYRQDEAYVPDGTPQFAEYAQVLGIKQDLLIHELTKIIQDREAAEAAGWIIDNCVEAINKAMPKGVSNETGATTSKVREQVDAVREGNLGASFSSGAKVVKLAHVLAIETDQDGKVTHFIVNRDAPNKLLFKKEARFDSMPDILTLFTFEPGNSKFYGSMGLGRMLVNPATAIDVVTNDLVDQARLAGLVKLKTDMAKGPAPSKIKKPFLWVSNEAENFKNDINLGVNIQAGIALLNELKQIVEVAAQQYVPNTLGEDGAGHATATEKRIDYTRELQNKAGFIARFAGQLADLIGMMQRAMCNPETNDKEAMEFREQALGKGKEGDENYVAPIVTEEELQEFATSPAAEVLQDLTAQEDQAKIAAANDPEMMQSPMIDQKKRLETKLTAMLPVPLAMSWFKADANDPGETAEQFRQQAIETQAMIGKAPIGVAPRDNDKDHLTQSVPDLLKATASLTARFKADPTGTANDDIIGETLDHLNAGWKHAQGHLQQWAAKGGSKDQMTEAEAAVSHGINALDTIAGVVQKIRAQQPPPGQPPGAPGQAGPVPPEAMPPVPPQPGQPTPGAQESQNVDVAKSEKIATAWIGQFDKLTPDEQRRLTMITGLSTPAIAAAEAVASAAPPTAPVVAPPAAAQLPTP